MQGEARELLAWEWEGLKWALEVYGAELLLSLPLAVMFGLAHAWGVAAASVVRSAQRYPYPLLLLQGPGQVSDRKRLLMSLFTLDWLITLWMWPSPFIFILGCNSVQFMPETGLAGSTSVILGRVSGFFLVFLHGPYTQCLLLPQPFCKTCSVPGFIE